MGKKEIGLRENPAILAKRQRMAANIKEVNPNHRKMKFGAFLRKYGRVLIGGGIILAVVFCSVFAGLLTEWDPEKTDIPEAKQKLGTMGDTVYWFGIEQEINKAPAEVKQDDMDKLLDKVDQEDASDEEEKVATRTTSKKSMHNPNIGLSQSENNAILCQFYTEDGSAVAENVTAGTAYKMGLVDPEADETVVFYLTGAKSGNKLKSSDNVQNAANFYLEESENGYYLYTMKGDAKVYVNLIVQSNLTKLKLQAEGITEYTLKAKNATISTTVIREHVLGTDAYGRDMWARLIFGSRNTLLISLGAQVILTVAGTLLGLLCGYYTKVEKYLMRVLDAMATIPNLLLCLLMVSVFGSGVPNLMLAMSFHGIPGLARMIRNQVLSLREKEYIESEKAMGASDIRTVILHILPACSSYLLVRFSSGLASAILSMTSLSYLGVGLDPTIASWGGMIQNSQKIMFALPHSFMVPTVAIAVTVFGFAMLGDGLRDLLDPKLR